MGNGAMDDTTWRDTERGLFRYLLVPVLAWAGQSLYMRENTHIRLCHLSSPWKGEAALSSVFPASRVHVAGLSPLIKNPGRPSQGGLPK